MHPSTLRLPAASEESFESLPPAVRRKVSSVIFIFFVRARGGSWDFDSVGATRSVETIVLFVDGLSCQVTAVGIHHESTSSRSGATRPSKNPMTRTTKQWRPPVLALSTAHGHSSPPLAPLGRVFGFPSLTCFSPVLLECRAFADQASSERSQFPCFCLLHARSSCLSPNLSVCSSWVWVWPPSPTRSSQRFNVFLD